MSLCCVYGDRNSGGDVVCQYAVYMVTALVGANCVTICCVYVTALVGAMLCVDMLCIW